MISKSEMMAVLLEACPMFATQWNAFIDQWSDEGDELPLYISLGDFARHLIGMLEREETQRFPAIFSTVERLHVEGDSYVKEAATVGLLESLQNENLHKTTHPEQICQYLGPESTRWWNKLNRFWQNGELLNDD